MILTEENKADGFHTPRGYRTLQHRQVTESMEDYMEMICRYALLDGFVRISTLADKLNVKPSSASKMVKILKEMELVDFERYGFVKPSQKGWTLGNYLLYRHEILHRFFCMINESTNELEQTEQVEHYINETTVRNIERFLSAMEP
ncbi:metal-dependent transcriptional regulator [Candidatus Soleaferrea massiliensis]|uniref:metal-dependent transcriptional regulator n=1 Tax=Candidatus Soleaferrea massiliensis TaxID=1470354 RepID=UPI002A4E215D|nr:iron dependent repressor, metal binding and dimerization domain protein [Candidatus Soleaferrea massiliensis]